MTVSCEADSKNRMSKSAKIGFRIPMMWRAHFLNNCDERQPSCAILQYMYNNFNMHSSLSVPQQYDTLGNLYV